MYTVRRCIAVISVMAASVVALSACGQSGNQDASGTGKSGTNAKHYVIGWSNPQAKQPIWQTFTKSLTAAAKQENIDITTLDAQANPSKQVSDIHTFITEKVDAIIVLPLQGQVLTPALEEAHAAGIHIIGVQAVQATDGQAPVLPSPYETNLDQGYAPGGKQAGEFVANQLHGKGNVVGINFPVPVPALMALVGAYQQGVTAGHPDIHWLQSLPDSTDDLAGAQKSMADAVTRYNGGIDAVMAYTDIAGIGARQALDAASLKNVIVIGQQGNQIGIDAVRKGQLQADLDMQPWMEGVITLSLARDVLDGKAVPKFVQSPTKFITKDNLNSYVPWDSGVSKVESGKIPLHVDYSKLPASS